LWDGKGKFDWLKIMTPDIRSSSYNPLLPPIPMYTTIRMWWVFRSFAPSQKLEITTDAYAFPFSTPVDRAVTLEEMMDVHRTHYEGTEFDMRLGALAGPFQSPNRVEGGAGMAAFPGQFARSPSIGRTSYTQVSQTGPAAEPAVWFSPDCSASSVFVPFFAKALTGAGGGKFDVATFGVGSMKEFSFTDGLPPAWWAFDFVANWMELSYKNMSETYVYPKVQRTQREIIAAAQDAVAKASRSDEPARVLADEQTRLQRRITEDWWQFAAMLIVRYNDYFFNFGPDAPQKAAPIGYPPFWLEMVGFGSESYYPTWFARTPEVPSLLAAPERALAELTAAHPPSLTSHRSADSLAGAPRGPAPAAGLGAPWAIAAALALACAAGTFSAGVLLGLRLGRRGAADGANPYFRIDA